MLVVLEKSKQARDLHTPKSEKLLSPLPPNNSLLCILDSRGYTCQEWITIGELEIFQGNPEEALCMLSWHELTCGSLEYLGLPRQHGNTVQGLDSEAGVLLPEALKKARGPFHLNTLELQVLSSGGLLPPLSLFLSPPWCLLPLNKYTENGHSACLWELCVSHSHMG